MNRDEIANTLSALGETPTARAKLADDIFQTLAAHPEKQTQKFKDLYQQWQQARYAYDDYGFYSWSLQSAYLTAERVLADYCQLEVTYQSYIEAYRQGKWELSKKALALCRQQAKPFQAKVQEETKKAKPSSWFQTFFSAFKYTVILASTVNAAAAQRVLSRTQTASNTSLALSFPALNITEHFTDAVKIDNEHAMNLHESSLTDNSTIAALKILREVNRATVNIGGKKINGLTDNPIQNTHAAVHPKVQALYDILKEFQGDNRLACANRINEYFAADRDLQKTLEYEASEKQSAAASHVLAALNEWVFDNASALVFSIQATIQDPRDKLSMYRIFMHAGVLINKLTGQLKTQSFTLTTDDYANTLSKIRALQKLDPIKIKLISGDLTGTTTDVSIDINYWAQLNRIANQLPTIQEYEILTKVYAIFNKYKSLYSDNSAIAKSLSLVPDADNLAAHSSIEEQAIVIANKINDNAQQTIDDISMRELIAAARDGLPYSSFVLGCNAVTDRHPNTYILILFAQAILQHRSAQQRFYDQMLLRIQQQTEMETYSGPSDLFTREMNMLFAASNAMLNSKFYSENMANDYRNNFIKNVDKTKITQPWPWFRIMVTFSILASIWTGLKVLYYRYKNPQLSNHTHKTARKLKNQGKQKKAESKKKELKDKKINFKQDIKQLHDWDKSRERLNQKYIAVSELAEKFKTDFLFLLDSCLEKQDSIDAYTDERASHLHTNITELKGILDELDVWQSH